MNRSAPFVTVSFFGALVACSNAPPSSSDFTLTVPARVAVAEKARSVFTIEVSGNARPVALTLDGLPSGVTAAFDTVETQSRAQVTLTVASGTPAGQSAVRLTARSAELTKTAAIELSVAKAPTLPTKAVGLEVRLDKLFYAPQDTVRATVDFGAITAPRRLDVFLSSTDSLDVERLTLEKTSGNEYRSREPVVTATLEAGAAPTQNDGTLQLHPGDAFHALYFVDASDLAMTGVESGLVSDFAFFDGPARAEATTVVSNALALTPDEASAARPIATLLRKGELPLQFAAKELIATPESQAELDRLLALTGGMVVDEQPVTIDGSARAYLIEVPTTQVSSARLSVMRHFLGDDGELASSRPEGLGLYGMVLMARLDGLHVSINPRLSEHGAPTTTEDAGTSDNMKMIGRAGETSACLPGTGATNPCVRNVPALWTYLSVMDKDTARVRVGVLDYGFAPNADFRREADGGFQECRMTRGGPSCGPGAAQGTPNAGAFGGERVWHGTGSVSALGGIVNNDFGGAGTGGQVAVPMMYRYDNLGFVFDIGRGVRTAVDQGASVINISAGYPCSVATNVGPDLDLCTPAGRAAICAVVASAAIGAAALVCSIPLPDFGIACGVATGVGATAVSACATALQANFTLGDPRDAMRSGIVYAQSRGVPVIVSAGNAYSSSVLPDVIRDYVNLNDRTTNRWGVVPAMLPEVITVGAANTSLDNQEFYGARVDIWAPIYTSYVHPSNPDDPRSPLTADEFNGTSDAAPYTTGVVAAMQAVNPSLNPQTPGLTSADRRSITERVRSLLRDSAWTNAQLVELGYGNQATERPRLLNPLAAVKRAGRGVLPDLAALGYDDNLNFEEVENPDDTASQARLLDSSSTWLRGTIGGIPKVGDSLRALDTDFFRVSLTAPGVGLRTQDVVVRTLGGATEIPSLVVDRTRVHVERVSSTALSDVESETVFRLRSPDAEVTFALAAQVPGADFFYRVRLGPSTRTPATVAIVEPAGAAPIQVCVGQPIRFEGSAVYLPSSFEEPAGRWLAGSTVIRSTIGPFTHSFTTLGRTRVTLEAGGGSAFVDLDVVACTVAVRVVTPSGSVSGYPMGSDPFLRVTLVGEIRDATGAVLPTTGYTFEWYTNRGDLQPGAPTTGQQLVATGASTTGNFYAEGGQPATVHQLVLVVKQAGVEVGRSTIRLVTVQLLI